MSASSSESLAPVMFLAINQTKLKLERKLLMVGGMGGSVKLQKT